MQHPEQDATVVRRIAGRSTGTHECDIGRVCDSSFGGGCSSRGCDAGCEKATHERYSGRARIEDVTLPDSSSNDRGGHQIDRHHRVRPVMLKAKGMRATVVCIRARGRELKGTRIRQHQVPLRAGRGMALVVRGTKGESHGGLQMQRMDKKW
jgi:hypothetical protein